MKKRVDLSTWCLVMTAIGLIVLLFALYFSTNIISTIIVIAALVILCGAALFYMPLSVSVDEENLNVLIPLRVKSIPLDEISSIELCPPTMAEWRMCGSGGWFGYWGWFREPSIGKYFAYYGRASECFLVTLKDGKKYMLSCKDPDELVHYAQNHLQRPRSGIYRQER